MIIQRNEVSKALQTSSFRLVNYLHCNQHSNAQPCHQEQPVNEKENNPYADRADSLCVN